MPVSVPLETVGGLVCSVRPEELPEGASPRTYDTDFTSAGRWVQRPGLGSVFSYANSGIGPNAPTAAANTAVTGNAWENPANVLADDANYAVCGSAAGNTLVGGSDALDITGLNFNIPDPLTGLQVALKGWATSAVTLTVQLLLEGEPIGTPFPLAMPLGLATLKLGGPAFLWGASQPNVNDTTFGLRITASSSFSGASVLLGYVTVVAYEAASTANFNYVTTTVLDNGTTLTLAIDAAGNWWMENLSSNPGVLTLVMEGLTPGSFGSSVTADDSEFVCFSDGTTGSDLPRRFTQNPQTLDRVSQVGPGSSPVFAALGGSAAGTPVTITAYSVSSDVVTLTAANSLTAGTPVLFAGMTSGTFLNGETLTVLGTGLSGTQFEVAFATADVSTTADSGTATPQTEYPIATITQPAAQVRGSSYFLQSSGPGSTSPGNVGTVYYSDSTAAPADADLVAAFNSGYPVYLYFSFTGAPTTIGPLTVQVTSVGLGSPPGQPRQFYYFTYTITGSSQYLLYAGSGHPGYTANYQRTLATLTTSTPIPVLGVGSAATIIGASVSQWDSTWTITQALNSGAMEITQTSLTSGVATYSYNVVSGADPTAGQLVTITNTLNADGLLNGTDLLIASATGGSTGQFTVGGFETTTDYGAQAEAGQATTAGTEFAFDPGAAQVGTANDPIYGDSTGGFLVFVANGQYVSPGIKQGVVFFITENGFETAPSPPVTFTVPQNTVSLQASQIAIGPPNVIARGIALTESGTNGVPGANFFTIPNPVQFVVDGVTYTATSLVINDNTTTTALFSFPDSTLLEATAIDVAGNDLFNLVELGNPAWVKKYASRLFYGLCQNKIQNFLNLTFDGGYLPGSQLTPLGWTVPDEYGQLQVSAIFGSSYYIKNTTGDTLATAGLISQSAYQDSYLVPILRPNVAYSARVCARRPSGATVGSLVVDLVANGISYGNLTLPFAQLAESFTIQTGTLLTTTVPTVPAALQLRLYASGIGAGADVEVDRIEIFPTLKPVLTTDVLVSYANNLESVDVNTGNLDTSENNSQACYGAAEVLKQLVLLKERSMYLTEDSANFEPGADPGWNVDEISSVAGTCGINAYDSGDEWLLTMNRAGIFGYAGGKPDICSRELQSEYGPTPTQYKGLWESLNWAAANTFWLRNDMQARRFYCGVALPTPNFWLPNAPANAAPAEPNVILMCNYEGCPTFDELMSSAPVHTTIMGQLKALEQRRKWSIWQIPAPYAAMVQRSTGPALTMLFCNGIASGKIYELVPQQGDDDGVPVYPLYTSYGFVGAAQGQQLGLGTGRKLATYWYGDVRGSGYGGLRFYPNTLSATFPQTNPLALRLQGTPQDLDERKVELGGQRIFIEITGHGDGQGGPGYIECGQQVLEMSPHPWTTKRGRAL